MRMEELRCKEIINVSNGHRLGFVCDVEFDASGGKVVALVCPGRARFFGLFGREDDYILPFECISRIGDDIILIDVPTDYKREKLGKKPLF